VRALEVAGAFHTSHMAPAVDALAGYAKAITTHDPRIPLISNADGRVVHDGRDVLRRLVTQVRNPVRWDMCMSVLADLGVTAVIEIPPAGTLTGLIKRALPGVETLALKTPDDLPAAWNLIERHGRRANLENQPTWRLLVAPIKGSFRMGVPVMVGEEFAPTAIAGTIETLRDSIPVVAPHGGVVVEWLVEDGDPVAPGQPIVRLHPIAQEAHS
jgi:[acyl-carrier-protein] S-malonyltransferase